MLSALIARLWSWSDAFRSINGRFLRPKSFLTVTLKGRGKGQIEDQKARYMHDLESFANERHPFIKRSVTKALSTKVTAVSTLQ
jgi:hypothetical protein